MVQHKLCFENIVLIFPERNISPDVSIAIDTRGSAIDGYCVQQPSL